MAHLRRCTRTCPRGISTHALSRKEIGIPRTFALGLISTSHPKGPGPPRSLPPGPTPRKPRSDNPAVVYEILIYDSAVVYEILIYDSVVVYEILIYDSAVIYENLIYDKLGA